MENKNIIILKHHPMNVKFTNPWYTNQVKGDLKDYLIVDVTSRVQRDKEFMKLHPDFAKEVSPFFMGPVIASDGSVAKVFEHYWQASKVYPCFYDARTNSIKKDYWPWRNEWFQKERVTDKRISRRPCLELGYKESDCLFSVYYNNGTYEHLGYVDAKKKLYIPEYAKLFVKTEAYKWLKEQLDAGKKIALVDFDGFNYYEIDNRKKQYNSYINKCADNGINPTKGLNDFINLDSIEKVINCDFRSSGHGYIIKMLLEEDIKVEKGKVIDTTGILN